MTGVGIAAGGAFAAALIGLGTTGVANADPTGTIDSPFVFPDGNPNAADANVPIDDQGYSALFGAEDASGNVGFHTAALDSSLFSSNPGEAASFFTDVSTFEASADHPLEDLIYAIDPSAFYVQHFDGIVGDLANSSGGYLVPADGLGLLATDLDYFLTGTGLTFLLDPAVNVLAGSF